MDSLADITKMREQEMKQKKTPNLNQPAATFFTDEIHKIMAHREKPMYEYYKENENLVKCSKEKFLALPQEDKVRGVLEEAYVIALERAIIPMLFEGGNPADPDSAFRWAVMRICTTLTGGWFRDWAVENFPAVQKMYDRTYATRFLTDFDQGRIKIVRK